VGSYDAVACSVNRSRVGAVLRLPIACSCPVTCRFRLLGADFMAGSCVLF
jgi:hypothetical protein